jgi:hypothetical protein
VFASRPKISVSGRPRAIVQLGITRPGMGVMA